MMFCRRKKDTATKLSLVIIMCDFLNDYCFHGSRQNAGNCNAL